MSIKYDNLVTLERDINTIVNAGDGRLTSKIKKLEIKVDGQITTLKWLG